MNDKQIVTVTFFEYKGWKNKWWAFQRMGIVPDQLLEVEGLTFGKLLGSGANKGFSIFPNLEKYGLLCVWQSEAFAKQFFEENDIYQDFLNHIVDYKTVYLQTAKSHGFWEGQNPFQSTCDLDKNEMVGVLTRATIYPKYLVQFWRFVPKVSASIEDKEGRLFSIGIGELPLIQQATFSLWSSSTAMMEYAYKSKFHKEVVQKTRALGWYKEELFARFRPYKFTGNWKGIDLPELNLSI